MNDMTIMILALIAGSLISLGLASVIFLVRKRRERAIAITLPIGAGALLAAAFFDLLPEALEVSHDAHELMAWTVVGFLAFFILERSSSWFHHHHEHQTTARNSQQNRLLIVGDLIHNVIDGAAVGAAFVVSVPTGIITALAVSAHEIPKEIGTFGILLSRGWRDRKVLLANIFSAFGTIIAAVAVYVIGKDLDHTLTPILAMTAGFFIYVAASDIIPDIHEQPRRTGMIQAAILVASLVFVASLIEILHGLAEAGH